MNKRARWAARLAVAEHRLAPYRVRLCGRQRFRKHVDVFCAQGSAWFDGVVRCRTRYCPVCWISRRARAAHEIRWVVDRRCEDTGQVPLLATMTVRHSSRDPVDICRRVRDCWRLHVSGKQWQAYRKGSEVEWITAEEVTFGQNGWHPHLHALLLPRGKHGDVLARAQWWNERWCSIVRREMGAEHEPDPLFAFDLRPITAAEYLTKLGLELTDAGAVKGRAPLALLQEGEIDRYVELQHSRHRARDLTFSRGLKSYRESLPPPPTPELTLQLRGSEYGRLFELGPDAVLSLLEAAAQGDGVLMAERLLGPLLGIEEEGK